MQPQHFTPPLYLSKNRDTPPLRLKQRAKGSVATSRVDSDSETRRSRRIGSFGIDSSSVQIALNFSRQRDCGAAAVNKPFRLGVDALNPFERRRRTAQGCSRGADVVFRVLKPRQRASAAVSEPRPRRAAPEESFCCCHVTSCVRGDKQRLLSAHLPSLLDLNGR
ncbi:hypothetical protein AOLI_G00013110 [Acnodon oligacanthus]